MNKLYSSHLPPLLTPDYKFTDEDYLQESDYQDYNPLQVGTHQFRPNWKSVIPQDLQNLNRFCPYCGRFVQPSQQMACQIQGTKGFLLGHKKCVENQANKQIQLQYEKSTYTIQKGSLEFDHPTSILGQKEHVLSATISHSLSDYKYLNMDKKIVMSKGQVIFCMQEDCESSCPYDLNKIIVPLPQMNLNLSLREIGSKGEGQQIRLNFDLSQIFVGIQITQKHSDWIVTSSNQNKWTAKVEIRLIFDEQEKRKQLQMMNFKYPHQLVENLPLVKLSKIMIRSKQYETIIRKSEIQNTKASSSYEQIYEQTDEDTSSISQQQANFPILGVIIPPSIDKETRIQSSQFIKETKMQNSQTLKDIRTLAKTQGGSKELQRRVREMRTTERDEFIDEISALLYEFIQNDYANYMVQTLISCCNSKQRLKVFEKLRENAIELICLKQGTFAFQQMICYMETHEEFMMITQMIEQNMVKVATDANGNHFLRKLIPTLPFWYNEILIDKILTNFLSLVNDKNSVCALKVMLHCLGKQSDSQKTRETRRRVIQLLKIHTEKIIRNQYGNYFLQEAYEVFFPEQMKEISELLFVKFRQLAKEKFSSSVLCRCISSYWRGSGYYDKLKVRMSNSEIVELFKNKEGNKVLLELINSEADSVFKSRISSAINSLMPSKFNSLKWSNVRGVKSSNRMVSSEPNYFSYSQSMGDYETQIKVNPMTKKRPYNIQ